MKEFVFVNSSSDPVDPLASAIASGRQILLARFKRGRTEFSMEHLRDSLGENGSFVDAIISAFVEQGLIEEQPVEPPQGVTANLLGLSSVTYRISPKILEIPFKAHLGLSVDETRLTIQRPDFCRHVVTLSPTQMKLAAAMCEGGEAGIVVSVATKLRGGEKTGERQFRTSFNRSLALLGVRLERFAWRLVEK
jgi:hypothetical protein